MTVSFKTWLESDKNKLASIIHKNQIIFVFKKDGELYGADEDGRLTFSKFKHPDDEDPSGWKKEATFTAISITKALKGEESKRVFDRKSSKGIEIISNPEEL